MSEDPVALLRQRIAESGVSARQFARDVLWRDPRTIRRWLAGDSPIPRIVVEKLAEPKPPPWPIMSRPLADRTAAEGGLSALAALIRRVREADAAERPEDIAKAIWPDFFRASVSAQAEEHKEEREGFQRWMKARHAAKKG